MKILVVAAHPDDEVLGCGGTIARWAQTGDEIHIGILGEGITSRSHKREEADFKQVEKLLAKSKRVGELLGAKNVITNKLPDNRFDSWELLDIVKIIEDWIERIEPEIIFTQHGGDLNIDHNLVFRAVLTASRPVQGGTVKTIYGYEVPSSTEWAFQSFSPVFKPNVFVDISDTLELKIKAMDIYDSEARDFPHPRSAESLRAIARRWGSAAGLQAAEAFELIRQVI